MSVSEHAAARRAVEPSPSAAAAASEGPLPLLALRTRAPAPRDVRTTGFCTPVELAAHFDRVAFFGPDGSGRTELAGELARSAGDVLSVALSPGDDVGASKLVRAAARRWPAARLVTVGSRALARALAGDGFHMAPLEPLAVADVAAAARVDEDEVAASGLTLPWEASWAYAYAAERVSWPRNRYDVDRFAADSLARAQPAGAATRRRLAVLGAVEAARAALARSNVEAAARAILALVPDRAERLEAARMAADTAARDRSADLRASAAAALGGSLAGSQLVVRVALASFATDGADEALGHAIVDRIERDPAMEPETRIELCELLGSVGDPRISLDALPVPGGRLLGRHPVTVGQYRPFVAAGGAVPDDWVGQLRHPARPVTGVSWHDAAAFAAWIGERNGRACRLPSSDIWTAAASHDAGPYPWGAAEPDPERLNFAQVVGHCTPVLAYPAGAGPHGHLDLVGNAWEWCADGDETGRTVRGGGWYTKADYTRSDYEFAFHPDNRFHDLGFRLELGPAS